MNPQLDHIPVGNSSKEGLIFTCVACSDMFKREEPKGDRTDWREVPSMCDKCIDVLCEDPAIKTRPRRHQAALYPRVKNLPYYALHWEMGLGKTKLICDVAAHLFLEGRIDALLVLAPNEVYTNWLTEEMPTHMSVPYAGMALKTRKSKLESEQMKMLMMLNQDDPDFRGRLRFVCASYDALRVDRTFDFLKKFVLVYRTKIVSDESSRLKNAETQQAKRAKELANYCHYKWEATGTPASESPFGLHSQVQFLDPDFWGRYGLKSISAFRTEFGVFEKRRAGKRIFNECVDFRNLDKLRKIMEPISHRLLKEDAGVDLPPKVYSTYRFDLTDEQAKIYTQLRDEYMAELDHGLFVEAPMAIVRMTRLQQICCGHLNVDEYTDTEDEEQEAQTDLPLDGPVDWTGLSYEQIYEKLKDQAKSAIKEVPMSHLMSDSTGMVAQAWMENVEPLKSTRKTIDIIPPGENPRLKLLLELIDQATGKVIVFCRFKRDVNTICDALGDMALRYDGSTKHGLRPGILKRFRDKDDPVRVLVANVHAMSMGVTLTIAKTMVFYSNSFSLEKRLQAEDRFHRIGQDESVHVIDIVADGTVDLHIGKSMQEKFDIQAQVTGDRFREWIKT